MKVLRIEPFSGISGDMMLGALVDLAGGQEKLLALPQVLGLAGASVRINSTTKCGIQCTAVKIEDKTPPKARHLKDILALIEQADLSPVAKAFAGDVFLAVGQAEAKVHGVSIESIHFHEVGAIDSILDIVGAAVLLDDLDFDQVVADPICVGHGFVTCDHGKLPVPAPATALLLHGLPTYPGDIRSEMTTPTGAAILKALKPVFTSPVMTMTATGYGAGSRDFDQPNCLRLGLGQAQDTAAETLDDAWLIQTNLDDVTGELLGAHLQDLLLEAGALDINLCSLIMKKGRPGQRLEVLCHKPDLDRLMDLILTETTTIGVRYFPVARRALPRTLSTVTTKFGPIGIKCVTLPSGKIRKMPEYEDCRQRAQDSGVSLQDVMREALHRCCDD